MSEELPTRCAATEIGYGKCTKVGNATSLASDSVFVGLAMFIDPVVVDGTRAKLSVSVQDTEFVAKHEDGPADCRSETVGTKGLKVNKVIVDIADGQSIDVPLGTPTIVSRSSCTTRISDHHAVQTQKGRIQAPLLHSVAGGSGPLFRVTAEIERLVAGQIDKLRSPIDGQASGFRPQRQPSDHPLKRVLVRLSREPQHVKANEMAELERRDLVLPSRVQQDALPRSVVFPSAAKAA